MGPKCIQIKENHGPGTGESQGRSEPAPDGKCLQPGRRAEPAATVRLSGDRKDTDVLPPFRGKNADPSVPQGLRREGARGGPGDWHYFCLSLSIRSRNKRVFKKHASGLMGLRPEASLEAVLCGRHWEQRDGLPRR